MASGALSAPVQCHPRTLSGTFKQSFGFACRLDAAQQKIHRHHRPSTDLLPWAVALTGAARRWMMAIIHAADVVPPIDMSRHAFVPPFHHWRRRVGVEFKRRGPRMPLCHSSLVEARGLLRGCEAGRNRAVSLCTVLQVLFAAKTSWLSVLCLGVLPKTRRESAVHVGWTGDVWALVIHLKTRCSLNSTLDLWRSGMRVSLQKP